MNVLPLFIDDWLSSPRIEAMDAAEERGYMRLLMRGAKNGGWLPADYGLLAVWSKLGPQWNRQTHDKQLRIRGVTSGQKLLACFEEKEGRLYNERLSQVVEEWRQRQEHSAKANRSRWPQLGKSPDPINGSAPNTCGDPPSESPRRSSRRSPHASPMPPRRLPPTPTPTNTEKPGEVTECSKPPEASPGFKSDLLNTLAYAQNARSRSQNLARPHRKAAAV